MNMREHLDALCDVKVWWRKNGVKCSWIHWPSIDDDAAHRIAYANCYESALGIDHAFRNRAMHQEYPGHVLYVKFHGDETTCYLLDSDGALVNRTVLLRNPGDEPNAYALWAYIVREMVPERLRIPQYLKGNNLACENFTGLLTPGTFYDVYSWYRDA